MQFSLYNPAESQQQGIQNLMQMLHMQQRNKEFSEVNSRANRMAESDLANEKQMREARDRDLTSKKDQDERDARIRSDYEKNAPLLATGAPDDPDGSTARKQLLYHIMEKHDYKQAEEFRKHLAQEVNQADPGLRQSAAKRYESITGMKWEFDEKAGKSTKDLYERGMLNTPENPEASTQYLDALKNETLATTREPKPAADTPHTTQTGEGVMQYNPLTKRYDIRAGSLPPRSEGGGANKLSVTDDDLEATAQTLLSGLKFPSQVAGGMGANSLKSRLQIYMAKNYPDYDWAKADAGQVAGNRNQKVIRSLDAVDGGLKTVEETSKEFDRTDIGLMNDIILKGKTQLNDPKAIRFQTAVQGVIDDLASALSGGGATTDAARNQAKLIFNTGYSQGGLGAAIGSVREVMSARRAAFAEGTTYEKKGGLTGAKKSRLEELRAKKKAGTLDK